MNEILLPGKCYMLRRNGELIGNLHCHPYVLNYNAGPLNYNINKILKYRSYLEWFRQNSLEKETIELINTVNKLAATRNASREYLEELIIKLNVLVNNEFLRLRMSDIKLGGASKSLFVRVSKTEHDNWYDLLWKVVNENDVTDITITQESFENETAYSLKGALILYMPKEEFLTLPGNPEI